MQRAVLFLLTICICIVLTVPVLAAESVRVCRQATSVSADDANAVTPPMVTKDAKVNYDGTLRVFVVEPLSRWRDSENRQYDFGFLSFAVEQAISVPYTEKLDVQAVWNGAPYGFGDVTEGNIMVMAVVYGDDPHQAYSDPPTGAPFWAYYVDAAAGATPGHTGFNTTTPTSTHTMFIEEGTATW